MFQQEDSQSDYLESYQSVIQFYQSTNHNNVRIIHINIRSIRQNFGLFQALLNLLNNEMDIIILSEIWIKKQEIKLYNIPDYHMLYNCREKNRSGGNSDLYKKIHQLLTG